MMKGTSISGINATKTPPHSKFTESLPVGDNTSAKILQAAEILEHCGLFVNAFIDTTVELEGY